MSSAHQPQHVATGNGIKASVGTHIRQKTVGAHAGSQRKGKYAPVRMLASRMGATWLLRLQPSLIGDMLQAMRFESVCPANAGLLEAVLGSLRHECMESAGLFLAIQPETSSRRHIHLCFGTSYW